MWWVYRCTVELCCVKRGDVTKQTGMGAASFYGGCDVTDFRPIRGQAYFLSVLWALFVWRVCTHVLRRLYNSLVVRALTTDCTLYSVQSTNQRPGNWWQTEPQNHRHFEILVQGSLRERWTKMLNSYQVNSIWKVMSLTANGSLFHCFFYFQFCFCFH